MTGRRNPPALEVALMVFLGPPEGGGFFDLRDDGAAEFARRIERLFGGIGRRFLLGAVAEDRRAILRADVGALAVGVVGSCMFQKASRSFS